MFFHFSGKFFYFFAKPKPQDYSVVSLIAQEAKVHLQKGDPLCVRTAFIFTCFVMISATMLVTGYTVVSAEGFTDAEALAEMDAFTTGDEAVYVEEVQPEAAQTEEVQPEQTQTEVQPEVAQTEEVQVEEPQAEESQDEFHINYNCFVWNFDLNTICDEGYVVESVLVVFCCSKVSDGSLFCFFIFLTANFKLYSVHFSVFWKSCLIKHFCSDNDFIDFRRFPL